jgi:hypothetical protein
MFPKGFRAREAAAKARSKQRIVSAEVREARARILDEREARAAGYTFTPNTDVLAGRVAKAADTPGLTLTVDGKLPKAFSTAIRPDGEPVLKVDGTAPDKAPKQNDNLVSLPPVNEDETGDQIASQISALTEGAPVPATVEDEAAPASAEAAKHPGEVEHGQESGETPNKVDEHSPAQTEGGNTEAQEAADAEAVEAEKPHASRRKAAK